MAASVNNILELPCAGEVHRPFALYRAALGEREVMLYGNVRTSSWEFDGCGGRTDAHDIFSVFWAAVLRATGAASTRLIDEEGMGGFPELYSRYLLFEQPVGTALLSSDAARSEQRLRAHTAWAWHSLADVFEWGEEPPEECDWTDDVPPWISNLREHLKCDDKDVLMGRRHRPDWDYFTSYKDGLSVVRLPRERALALRMALQHYRPSWRSP
jgi:hypothetical protein